MGVYKKRTMQGYANGIWSVIYSLKDDYIPWDLQPYVNLREVADLGYGSMELPNLIDFKVGKMPENVLYPPLSNKYPNFSVELVVYEAQVFGGELSVYFNEIESTLNDELRKDKPDYYAIRFIEGLKEYADKYKRYASILTLLEELIYYHQTGKNPYTKWADGTIHRDSMMPRAHELLNNWVCKLLKVVSFYVVPQQDQQKNDIEKVQNYSQESKQEQQQRDNKPTRGRGRPKETLKDKMINDADGSKLKKVHTVMNGRKGKDAALIVLACIKIGWMQKPTFKQLTDEFGNIGKQQGVTKYLQECHFTKDEIEGAINSLES